MEYKIELAQCDDAEELCATQMAAIEQFSASDYTPEEINAWMGHVNLPHALNTLQDEDTEVFVVRHDDGMVIGFSAARGNQVTDMYVDPDYCREGIGRALLRRAEWHIRKQGKRKIKLLSTLNSVDFYESQGYNKVRKRPMPVNDEMSLEMIEMRKTFSGEG